MEWHDEQVGLARCFAINSRTVSALVAVWLRRRKQGQVVAFKRYTSAGDIILVVVNVSDNQWAFHDYAVNMGGESGSWMECFNSQSPDYGGVNSTGNFNETLSVSNNQLFINLSSWSVVMFRKL